MNIADYLLDFLKQYNHVEVQNFGVFSFENSEAEVDTDKKVILPPAKRVVFISNQSVKGNQFLNFLAQKKGISLENARFELQTQVDFWQKKQIAKDDFSIAALGDFKNTEGQYFFEGKRVEKDSPDYFGLEKINYNQLDSSNHSAPKKINKEHSSIAYVFWVFLILLPVLGLSYAVYMYQDLLLGKKDTKEISIKTSTHRIEDEPILNPVLPMDSVSVDSITIKGDVPQMVQP